MRNLKVSKITSLFETFATSVFLSSSCCCMVVAGSATPLRPDTPFRGSPQAAAPAPLKGVLHRRWAPRHSPLLGVLLRGQVALPSGGCPRGSDARRTRATGEALTDRALRMAATVGWDVLRERRLLPARIGKARRPAREDLGNLLRERRRLAVRSGPRRMGEGADGVAARRMLSAWRSNEPVMRYYNDWKL